MWPNLTSVHRAVSQAPTATSLWSRKHEEKVGVQDIRGCKWQSLHPNMLSVYELIIEVISVFDLYDVGKSYYQGPHVEDRNKK